VLPVTDRLKMKNRRTAIVIVLFIVLVGSIFLTWDFEDRMTFKQTNNPLWDEQDQALDTPLIRDLRSEGFEFYTDRGAEADPSGICFGDFGSDVYWVVLYDEEQQEIVVSSWIVGVNWIGQLYARSRFSRVKKILEKHTK